MDPPSRGLRDSRARPEHEELRLRLLPDPLASASLGSFAKLTHSLLVLVY